MSAALTVATNQQRSMDKFDQADVIAAIKQTVAKGATDAQLKMFIEVCRTTGLNPWLKEIWFVSEKSIIMAGRDGYLRVANENPQFDGIETRVERDEKNVPIKAVCTVWRKDRTHPTVCEAFYSEYRSGSPVWSKYPSAMISKVAEVLALKRSFAINGVVSEEEMDATYHPALPEPQSKELARTVVSAEFVGEPQALRDDIAAHPAKARSNKPVNGQHIDLLQAFGALKKRYQAIGAEPAYYAVLGRNGYSKSNEIPVTDAGIRQARAIYKEMSLHCQDMEVLAAKDGEVQQ